MPDATVATIVVNYNGAGFLDQLAASLRNLESGAGRLILIDNASPDGSGARLRDLFPDAEVILNQRNLGLAAAINQALHLALAQAPELVLLLNPDTVQVPDFLERLRQSAGARTLVVPKVLDAAPGAGAPPPRLANHAGDFDWRRGLLVDTHDGEPDGSPASISHRELEVASFSCMLVPTGAFKAVGLLDEALGMYYEDTDFCVRARRAGFRILFEPRAVVYHREGGSSGGRESPFAVYYTTRNRPYLVRKHSRRLDYLLFSPYFLATRAARAMAYTRAGRRDLLRAMLLGLRDYYLGRTGMTYTPPELAVTKARGQPGMPGR